MHTRLLLPASLALFALTAIVFADGHSSLAASSVGFKESLAPSAMNVRAAGRLLTRVQHRFGFTLPQQSLLRAMREQRSLLGRGVIVEFPTTGVDRVAAFTGALARFPHWLAVDVMPVGIRSSIDTASIVWELTAHPPVGVRFPEHATLQRVLTDEDGLRKAQTDGVAKAGFDFDPATIAARIRTALEANETTIAIPLSVVAGQVTNATEQDVGALTLLSSGRSNFAGSGNGRKANVRKGLAEHLHNSWVEPGEVFSLDEVYAQVPIREWEMALAIFPGGVLRPVPGGGLCQVATTLYRGILNAGLPITQRISHSLFVHYYEKYGVGIDATIYPAGGADLQFRNDTDHPLLIQAYTEGDEATVNIFGTSDGRITRLEGPYFSVNAPAGLLGGKRTVKGNEIVWKRHVTFTDGRTESETFVSRYKDIPTRVVKAHTHAAAEMQSGI